MLTMPAGAEWMRDSATVQYEDLLNDASMGWCGADAGKAMLKLEKDRKQRPLSLPGKAAMRVEGEWEEGVERVLQAMILKQEKEKIVYHSSMRDMVAALLLLFQYDESKAFWTLAHAETLMEGYWSEGGPGMSEDAWIITELMQDITPDLHAHVTTLGITCGDLVIKWLASGYASALDTKALRLLWETALNKGEGRRALVAAAVALLKWAEEEILSEDNAKAAIEALSDAAGCCLEADDFSTAVDIWLEAIPPEEYVELKKDAQLVIKAQKKPSKVEVSDKDQMTVMQKFEGESVESGVVDKSAVDLKQKIGMWESKLSDYA